MKVRLYYRCTRCGSTSFRRSATRTLKESIWSHFGIHPQRCHMCRCRFFLFKPNNLHAFLVALDAPAQDGRELEAGEPMADATDA